MLCWASTGRSCTTHDGLLDVVDDAPEKPLTLQIERATNTFEVTLKAEKPITPADEKPRLGIQWNGEWPDRIWPIPERSSRWLPA